MSVAYLSLASSIGIVLNYNDSEELISFSADIESRRRIASSLISRDESFLSASEKQLISELISLISIDILNSLRISNTNNFELTKPIEIDFTQTCLSILSNASPLNSELTEFNDKFKALRLRDKTLVQQLPIYIYELIGLDSSVIAEGKGLDLEKAKTSCIGEAFERMTINNHLIFANTLVSTKTILQSNGVWIPEIDVGIYDLYNSFLPANWIIGTDAKDKPTAIPYDLINQDADPKGTAKAFHYSSTSGIASGSTIEFAALRSLIETIETDAYGLHIRLGIFNKKLDLEDLPLSKLTLQLKKELDKKGIIVHAFDISFDHPLNIVHCVLENTSGNLPALSHGLGSGFTLCDSLTKSLAEAVQVFSDLNIIAEDSPELSTFAPHTLKEPEYFWIDPANKIEILECLNFKKIHDHISRDIGTYATKSLREFINHAETNLGHISFYPLSTPTQVLFVVKTHAENAVSVHDRSKSSEKRINYFKSKYSIKRESKIPILT